MANHKHPYDLIYKPLVTEKAASMAGENKYLFQVDPSANKIELQQAFERLYPGRKVKRVQTMKIYPKLKRLGKHYHLTSVGKKAIFTIEGEPIEVFTGA